MNLTVSNKDRFISEFLSPLSKINNSCILKCTDAGVSTLMAANDNTVILYGRYTDSITNKDDTVLNLPDLGRLIKVLQCVSTSDICLSLNGNHIKFDSPDLRFKYHLLDEGILSIPPISVDKIKQLKYDTTFTITYNSLINLIKSSTFTLNLNKVYLSTKDGNVYAEINDQQTHNVDTICVKLSDKFTGDDIDTPLPVSFEAIRVVAGNRCESINIFVNIKLNVMAFEINNSNTKMTYIVSGLVK